MPANKMAIAGMNNFCPGTRMARSYKHGISALQVKQSGFNSLINLVTANLKVTLH
jgi:hypothetical protein